MARTFSAYNPCVPLGVTWEESLILDDKNQNPIDITGYDVRAQFYAAPPVRDPLTGLATIPPILELTSPSWYSTPPAWPVVEGASIPLPATQGIISTSVDVSDLWTFSPTNAKVKLYWAIILVNPDTQYAIPVVEGKVSFSPSRVI